MALDEWDSLPLKPRLRKMLRGKGVGGWKSKASDRDIWRSIIGESRMESHCRTKVGGAG